MELIEAIKARHSVRKYFNKPIERAKVAQLRTEIDRVNEESGLNVQLVVNEPKAFSTGLWKYGQFSGVENYLVMAGPKNKETEEKIGYYGEELVLFAQTIGLNSCWVGLTYKKIPGAFTLRDGDIVHCVIALGYGMMPGVQHPQKPKENFYESPEGLPPVWFRNGLEAALLAPTAVNQQKFYLEYLGLRGDGTLPKVAAQPLFSVVGYSKMDLGIVKYHFEVGAGTENFEWA
jgi:nitroreductase